VPISEYYTMHTNKRQYKKNTVNLLKDFLLSLNNQGLRKESGKYKELEKKYMALK
jgi:hypothetical protein